MKKYTKPMVEVVELSVKESLSALPPKFNKTGFTFSMGRLSGITTGNKNVSVYTSTSKTIS